MNQRIDPFAALDPCAILLLRQTIGAPDLDRVTSARQPGLVRALRAALARDPGIEGDYRTAREALLHSAPDLRPHVTLLEQCAGRLRDVLAGRVLASDVMFPAGGMELVEPVYRGNRWSDHFNRLTATATLSALRARRSQAPDAIVRVLEVGAGTGGTSAAVLAALDAHAGHVTFDYTDVSMGFVQHGRRVHGARRPWFNGRVLDLEQSPEAQGFAAEDYDIVLGTNVLHATSRVAVSLGHVHHLLRPGGLLLLNEITRAGAFATMTFGLLDGWWAFQDADLRLPDAPVLSPDGWRQALVAAGFGSPAVFGWNDPPDASFQCLFVAERQARIVATPVVAPSVPAGLTESGLRGVLADRLAGLLGLEAAELAADRPLAEFGVDSIIAPQFVALLNRDLGASLVPTDIFNCATLQGLAAHMRGMSLTLPAAIAPAATVPDVAMPDVATSDRDRPATPVRGVAEDAERDIAVIGLACRFPGSEDADRFWDNIVAGRDAITEVPPDRWDGSADGRVRWGGFLPEHDCFDPEFFNLSWREAEAMSPQQRVFLEQAWHALENAGYGRRGLAGMRCGVFVGAAPDGYGVDDNDSLSSLGGSLAILAARISYLLDLKGPSLPVDTACSSSLVAVHLACQSVLAGDCDMALAGGVSILMTDHRLHAFLDDSGMLSPTGRCHTFDARADGFVPGEGVGVVVLKRLSQALQDGDAIIGVIKASGLNQDGRTSGITAPSGPAQTALETAVYERGGIDPNDITLVEAHGTGTQLGDPIEVNALATAFRQRTDRLGFCALGSVKTNIGHTLTAAGVAGLIKVLLALRHRTIPPSLNFSAANGLIGFSDSPFFVPHQAMPWSAPTRLAAVSSFGFSGTNAHVVVAEAPAVVVAEAPAQQAPSRDAVAPALILLSARTAEGLEARRADLLRWLDGHSPRLSDLAFTLSQGRGHFEHRLAILVEGLDDLRAWRGRVWRGDNLILPARGGQDEALAAALADSARDFARVAACYVDGGDADWTPLAQPGARRIALPGYPFARLRFPTRSRTRRPADAMPRGGHPMLAARAGDDAVDLVLDPTAPWLKDHQFNGAAVLPAVAYVESARAAVAGADDQAVELSDIHLDAPLVAHADVAVRIVLRDGGFSFIGTDGTVHARGRAAVVPTTPRAAWTDVAAIAERLPRSHAGDEIYARFRDLGFAYGPAFRVIRSLRADRETVLAELVPAGPVPPGVMLDPALLDGAVQAAIGLMLAGTETFASAVPVAIGRVAIQAPVIGPCLAHVTLLHAGTDTRRLRIVVLAPDGHALATFDDLMVRVTPAAERRDDIAFLAPAWEPAPIADADPPAALLLFDREEALWRDLGTTPVLVRPGSAFCRLDTRCFAIDPNSAEDHARLLAVLRDEGILPATVWHLWSRAESGSAVRAMPAAEIDATLRDGLRSIFHLSAAWARLPPADPVTILQACIGTTREAPLQAPIAAFAAGLGRENPLLRLASIALPAGDTAALRHRLSAETIVARDAATDRHERAVRWDASGVRLLRRLRLTAIPAPSTPHLPRQPVILLTGALGGIGRHVARHLARRHQARLALVGRSAPGPADAALVAEIRAAGGDAMYLPADIADAAQAAQVVSATRARFGPVQGVIHAAGVTRDRFLLHKTADDLACVLAPKLAGTLALDRATAQEPLACFVCFSSVAGSFGNAGQTDYSAANRFQDAFMAERAGPGRSLSIAWPYWRDGGLLVDPAEVERRTAATGLRPIETQVALDVFDALVGHADGTVLVMPGAFDAIDRLVRGGAMPPPAVHQPMDGDATDAAILYLRRLLARATAMPEDRINPDRPLEQYGIDSILVTRMNDDLSRDIPGLPRTLFFEHQTLRAAATFLASRHGAALMALSGAGSPVAAAEDPPAPASVPTVPDVVQPAVGDGIAIIGIAGRYPGAGSLDAFWANLCADRDLITEIPAERWNAADWHDPIPGTPGRSYSMWGGFLSDIDQFDPLFFNISPAEAAAIDPNERLFLETCWEALENAGHTRASLAHDPDRSVGVYAGVMYGEYQLLAAERANGHRPVGGSSPYWSVANRVSYHLDLHGPSVAVDSACSSSLTAIHLACQALTSGECSAAIAGGVNLSLHPLKYVGLSQGRFAASDGRCHSFAAGGDGYVPGEGVGAVILKPLAAAIADGDFIHAVIRGWATNHGGKTNGYTVPNPARQAGVIAAALRRGGVAPDSVSYIEAHGTGTALGDPIEVAGLSAAFGETVPRRSVALGSVKANIGHLEAAAGIVGLTRVVLQLRNRTLTPTRRHGPPNPNIDFAATPFRLQEVTEPWIGPVPLRGGVSSFGAGGANAHLVVEAFRPVRTMAEPAEPALFVLSARTPAQLRAYASRMAAFLRATPWSLADICHTLRCGREAMPARLAFIADTREAAADRLDRFLRGDDGGLWQGIHEEETTPPPPPSGVGPDVLARAWVAGATIDWRAVCLPGETVPVPAHPFMRRRYWLDGAASVTAPAPHPFLDRVVASLDGAVLEKRFRSSDWIIRDHIVRDRCLVPGVVQLEMARAAAALVRAAGATRPDDRAPDALLDVVWQAPLEVGSDGAATTVTLRRDDAAVAFEIALRDGTVVCRGRAATGGLATGTRIDLGVLRDRATRHLAAAEIYQRLAALGLRYGDSLRVLTDIWSDGRDLLAAVAPVTVPEGIGLPPAILDAALQALLGFVDAGARALLLPFALSAARWTGALDGVRFVTATRRPPAGDVALFDLKLCDADGEVLMRLDGLAARSVERQGMAMPPAAAPPAAEPLPLTFRQPVWEMAASSGLRPRDAIVVVAHAGDDLGLTARLRSGPGVASVRDWVSTRDRASAPPGRIDPAAEIGACVTDLVWVAVAGDTGDVAARAEAMALDLLRVVRSLDGAGRLSAGLRLRLITRGLQSLTPAERPDPSASPLLGLAKCIALEYPRVAVTVADFDAASLADARVADFVMAEPAVLPVREVAWRDGVRHEQALRPVSLPGPVAPLRPGSVVLIIGGAGGIGSEIAAWLARDCSARVALVGRRAEAEVAERIAAIPCGAGAVRYFQADATDAAALRAVVQRLRAIWGGVDAAIHAALVLRDRTLARMDEATFRAVLAPKIAGSVAMIEALSAESLRFVAFLSSVNVVSGSLGQANYVAGSSFVDAYARALAAERPWRVVVTDWGLWGDVGVVSAAAYRESLARQGVHPITPREGVAALASVLAAGVDRVAIARAEPLALRRLGMDRPSAVAAPMDDEGPNGATLADAEAAFATLERYGRVTLRDALAAMAGPAGKAWTTEGLRRRLGVAPRHGALFVALLHALAEDGLIGAGDGLWRLGGGTSAADTGGNGRPTARDDLDAAMRAAPWLEGPRRLLQACLDVYPALLRGEIDPVAVLFPQASMALVEAAYAGNPIADRFNRAVAEAAREYVAEAAREYVAEAAREYVAEAAREVVAEAGREAVVPTGPGAARLRVIELGAGTGSTTAVVLEALAPFADRVAYLSTDVSQRFLAHGSARFAGRPGLTFALYDVEREPEANGQAPGAFDLVLAANVLHATVDLGQTLRRVRRLLRPGGVLLLSEATRSQDFGTMVFGLTPGWWLAEDRARRIQHAPLATVDAWSELLREVGFSAIRAVTAGPASPHALLVAVNQEAFAGASGTVAFLPPAPPAPLVQVSGPGTMAAAARGRGGESGIATRLTDHLRAVLGDVLKLEPEEVRINESFDRYGLESLTALEVRNRLDRDIPGLPATLLFEHNTLSRLAAWLTGTHPDAVARLTGEAPAGDRMSAVQAPPAPATPAAVVRAVPPRATGEPALSGPSGAPPAAAMPSAVAGMPASSTAADEPIAIIGYSGRYPGGPSNEAFWRLLRAGDSAIGEVPADRWDAAAIYDPAGSEGSSHTKWAGFIPDVDRFDPLFFNIAPSDAEMMDPQERVFLETAWTTLEQAGYTPARLRERAGADAPDGGDVGIFVGAMNAPYQWVAAEAWAAGHPNAASTGFWSIANRVSFLLDFSGPSMVVDTACSASLTAIHLACESLRRGECGAALAGGVNLILHPRQFINLSQARMVSRGAECRAFGAGADGFVDGEGVGAVLLKRLSAAERDGDRIEGVILASAVNAGGRTSGFTVPNPKAQARVIRAAIRRTGVAAHSISYVEAHGTGTALGDPIEIAGLADVFGGARCAIGAVKANIGHLEAAAGVAGLAKVLLQLRHREIAPNRHAGTPNPLIDFAAAGFVLPTAPMAWEPAVSGGLLRAGLSSFGAGGANAHLIVQEYLAPSPTVVDATGAADGAELVILSARDPDRLRVMAGNLLAAVRCEPPRLADLAHTLRVGREPMAARLAVLARDLAELEASLSGWLESGPDNPAHSPAAARVLIGSPAASARLLAETEDGRRMLDGLVTKRDWARLARLWVDGADVDWSALPAPACRLLALPGYPFRRERYWLPSGAGQADAGATVGPSPAAPTAIPTDPPAATDQAMRTQLFSRTWNPAPIQGRRDPVPVLVLARDRRLAETLAGLMSMPVRMIQPGGGFAVLDGGTLRMDPTSDADHAALIAHVARDHPGGFAIVQALDWQADPDHGAGSLATILLTQAAQRGGVAGVRILHLFARADDRPLDQAVGSLARSAMQESDVCRLRAVGMADPVPTTPMSDAQVPETPDPLADAASICRDELLANDDAPEILYRGTVRHTPGIEPVAIDPAGATIGFRIGGAYLLVGGLGEVGCAIAERLGRDYRARIAIIGRSDPRGPALERLRGLRDGGIQVHYEACDLTDRPALDQALGRIRAALGRLHGVLHLARTVEDALLVRKSAASVGRVMAAKVAGSVTLDAALNGEDLDWFVLCSSLAAWLGLAGGGDYALACAFQSGFARLRQQKVERGERSGRTVAICWPQWRHDRYLNDAKLRRLAAEGLQAIDARDGLRIIAQALQSASTEVAAVKGSERALARVPMAYRQDAAPIVAPPPPRSSGSAEPETVPGGPEELFTELRGLSDDELAAYLDYLGADATAHGRSARGQEANDPARPNPRPAPVPSAVPEAPPGGGRNAPVPAAVAPPEQAVLDTVCEFLKLPRDRFTEHSEFAAFGMDSIKALHVAERLQKRLGVAVDPAMFYEYPTVAALAQALAPQGAARPARLRP